MQTFTVTVARDFDRPAAQVFYTWLDPDARRIFETPEGSGMAYLTFDTRAGGQEVVVIRHEGTEIGRMVSDIAVLDRPRIVIVQARGIFGGVVTMTMQTIFAITDRPGGCTFTGTSQMVTLGAGPTEDQVRAGWHDMLDRFTSVLDTQPAGDTP